MTAGQSAFRPGLALTLQAGAAFLIVLALAVWQFGRGMQKTALHDARLARLQAPPGAATVLSPSVADFTRVSLTGVYDGERQFFVAATPQAFQILTPLRTAAGVYLVNRGWTTPASAAEPPAGTVTVTGVVWPITALTPMAAQEPWSNDWPKTVRAFNTERMAAAVGALAREIRLQSGAGMLQPPSLAWDYSPGTHWGYTVQWLLIAAAVVGGYVVIGKRRGRQAHGDG